MKKTFYFVAIVIFLGYGANAFFNRMRDIDNCVVEARKQGLNIVKDKDGDDTNRVYLPGRSEDVWCLDVRKINGQWVSWDFTRK